MYPFVSLIIISCLSVILTDKTSPVLCNNELYNDTKSELVQYAGNVSKRGASSVYFNFSEDSKDALSCTNQVIEILPVR